MHVPIDRRKFPHIWVILQLQSIVERERYLSRLSVEEHSVLIEEFKRYFALMRERESMVALQSENPGIENRSPRMVLSATRMDYRENGKWFQN